MTIKRIPIGEHGSGVMAGIFSAQEIGISKEDYDTNPEYVTIARNGKWV